MNNENKKIELKSLTLPEIKELMPGLGQQKFRGEQIYNWMYNHLTTNFDEMENIPKALRTKLSEIASLKSLEEKTQQISKSTGTEKFLFQTADGHNIESVVIPDEERNTLCVSTQVGCPLDCKFCATGLMGYKRNLTTGEIVDQYMLAATHTGKENITNIVYMGMGEPLLNFDATIKSLTIFTSEMNTSLSRKRITVSTSGIPHKIKELADMNLRVKLAFSLHSCFEDIRSKIMPINKKYSLEDNIEALHYYANKTKTRITYEYTMIKGINDRDDDIKALTKLCRKIPSKINIIPFNSIAHMVPTGISAELEPSSKERFERFVEKLRNNNITVMVRNTQGDDIAAACGQLAVKFEK